MKKNKKNKLLKLIKFEKKFTGIGIAVLLFLWAVSFFTKISLSSVNIEVERLSKDVKTQEKMNQSLNMKINELASLENINEVANKSGLAYNNNNIRIVVEK